MTITAIKFITLLLFVEIRIYKSSLSCKNENNEDVDWFIAIKPPRVASFTYLSSQSNNTDWLLSSYSLTNENNLIALTIKQAYESKYKERFYVFYNDHDPSGKEEFTMGHSKGVITFDKNDGYWLVHSVPMFPFRNRYKYGKGQLKFGQSFICVSLKFENLESIVRQLLIMTTNVYSYFVPNDFSKSSSLMDKIDSLVENRMTDNEKSNIFKFETAKNFNLIHFGKSKDFNKDIYTDLIAPKLESSMDVESWLRDKKLSSSCLSKYKVYNIKNIIVNGHEYNSTMDHCKWAVSTSDETPFVCVGDVNRMYSQFTRGGGSLCVKNKPIWNLFQKVVKEVEPCPKFQNDIREILNDIIL